MLISKWIWAGSVGFAVGITLFLSSVITGPETDPCREAFVQANRIIDANTEALNISRDFVNAQGRDDLAAMSSAADKMTNVSQKLNEIQPTYKTAADECNGETK